MAHTTKSPGIRGAVGANKQLERIFEDVEKTVKPYPPITVRREPTGSQEKLKGKVVQAITGTSAVLLAAIVLYGMVTHDRELLFAALSIIQYSVLSLLAWALGKVVTSLLPWGKKHNGAHEEDQNTG